MTSNGNTAQKHLIKTLTETHQNPKGAYVQAIKTAPSKETAETIKRIFEKLEKEKAEKIHQLKEYLKGLETCKEYGITKATPEKIAKLKKQIKQLEQ